MCLYTIMSKLSQHSSDSWEQSHVFITVGQPFTKRSVRSTASLVSTHMSYLVHCGLFRWQSSRTWSQLSVRVADTDGVKDSTVNGWTAEWEKKLTSDRSHAKETWKAMTFCCNCVIAAWFLVLHKWLGKSSEWQVPENHNWLSLGLLIHDLYTEYTDK